jgi:hypothetical protein
VARQDLLELDECPDRGLFDAGDRRASGGAQADRDGDRLLVVEQERRYRGPGAKPVAAGRARPRVHRVAEHAQALDVAPDRPARYAEPFCQLRAGPVAACLEQGQELQQAPGGRGHVDPMLFDIEDGS